VDLHAIAWQEAMLEFGHEVSFEQVRSQPVGGFLADVLFQLGAPRVWTLRDYTLCSGLRM
jgi:hypothetical protein